MATPIYTVAELTTAVTRLEVEASIYRVMAKVGLRITAWRKDSVVRAAVTGVSVAIAALSKLQANMASAGFLEKAEGPWLKIHARDTYNETMQEATFAAGSLQLKNNAGGVYAFDPGELVVRNTVTGKTYKNLETISLTALQTKLIAISATEAGSASSADLGDITELVSPPMLNGVELTNLLPLTGRDEEKAATLRLRCSEKLGSLSPMGPWDAYAYAARNAKRPNGEPIGVSRIKISKDGYGNVYVYVASDDGEVLLADLEALTAAIDYNATTQGVTLYVRSARAKIIGLTGTVYTYNTSAMTDAELTAAIRLQVAAFLATQPVGGARIDGAPGQVFLDGLRAGIAAAAPAYIFHVALSSPGSDITLAADEVAVLGTLDLTISPQAPPEGYSA